VSIPTYRLLRRTGTQSCSRRTLSSQVLTDTFSDRTFEQLSSGKPALVATLRLSSRDKSWAPLILHNLKPPEVKGETKLQAEPTPWLKLVDAALCTSAAPLYFPPNEAPVLGYCVDGGLFANCPASLALAMAMGTKAASFNDIRILFIGTGTQVNGIDIRNSRSFDKPSDYGALAWLDPMPQEVRSGSDKVTPAFPLLSALMDASSSSHNYVCMQALGKQYKRVQVTLSEPVALDAVDNHSMEVLEKAADSIPDEEWNAITKWLKEQVA
jgi:predicted acylesterase/phospholipase RssA